MSNAKLSFRKEELHKNTMNYLAKNKDKDLSKDEKTSFLSMTKENHDSLDLVNSIFAFNNNVGKGILLCLQNQMSLAQAFMDFVQSSDTDKAAYSSNSSVLQNDSKFRRGSEASSQDTLSFKTNDKKDKAINDIASRIEKVVSDLMSVLSPFQSAKTEANTTMQKSHVISSPPTSGGRHWTQDFKRASVPMVLEGTIAKKIDLSTNSVNDIRRSSTDNSHHLINGLKTPSSTTNASNAANNAVVDSKNVRQFLKKKQASVNKANTSRLTGKLSPTHGRDESKDKSKISFHIDDSKLTSSTPTHPLREISLTRETNKTNKPVRDSERDRNNPEKLVQRQTSGLIPRKDLVEESIATDHNGDKTVTVNSSISMAMPSTETDRMGRIPELDGNMLIQSLNNLKMPPQQEKRIIKELLKEDTEGLGSHIKKPGTGRANLINAKWWRSWKEYVSFDSENENSSGMIGIYARPGKIINRGLLKYDVIEDLGNMAADLELREHLLEHHDFQVVSKRIFDMLSKWYGCDFEITRPLRVDPFKNNRLFVELYPHVSGVMDMRNKGGLKRTVSPQNNSGAGKVINNIIHTNLQGFQGKFK